MALTRDTSVGFRPAPEYPTYRYFEGGGAYTVKLGGSRIVPCPEGAEERVRHQDEEQHFAEYRESIIKEHADLSDEKLLEAPPFAGRGRNARWIDARRARNLA